MKLKRAKSLTILEPPVDEGVSDQDSDKSNGEYQYNANHMGRKLLATGCAVRKSRRIQSQHQAEREYSDSASEQEQEQAQLPPGRKSHKPPPRKKGKTDKPPEFPVWTKRKALSRPAEAGSYSGHRFLDLTDLTSPLQFFELFFDDDMVSYIVEQTNMYASQNKVNLEITADKLKTVWRPSAVRIL